MIWLTTYGKNVGSNLKKKKIVLPVNIQDTR